MTTTNLRRDFRSTSRTRRRSAYIGLLSLLTTGVVSATPPWSDAEVERRLENASQLSRACRVEAESSRQVTGDDCLLFSVWLRDDLPALADLLPDFLAQSTQRQRLYATFVDNLRVITETGEGANGRTRGQGRTSASLP